HANRNGRAKTSAQNRSLAIRISHQAPLDRPSAFIHGNQSRSPAASIPPTLAILASMSGSTARHVRYIGTMPDTISAFEFLAKPPVTDVPPVCVLFGEEPLLKREALDRIRAAVLPDEDAELSLTKFDGREVELREVLDELATVSMFGGGRRMVAVEE